MSEPNRSDKNHMIADALDQMSASDAAKQQTPPSPPRSATPASREPEAAASRPLRPTRPDAPARPAMPPPVARAVKKFDASVDPLARIVEDTNVPIGVALHGTRRDTASHPKPARRAPFYKSLSFRRTIIPILLTMGVALPALASGWFMLDRDAPLKQTGVVVPLAFFITGAVLLLLAIANMLTVRQQLRERMTR